MEKSKIYRFDNNHVALNPDVYAHPLKVSEKGRVYCLQLKMFIAKNNTGYVAGFSTTNMSSDYNSLPTISVPCRYYSVPFSSKNKAIISILIDLTKQASLEAFPVSMIVLIGNLLVSYCEHELLCIEKIG